MTPRLLRFQIAHGTAEHNTPLNDLLKKLGQVKRGWLTSGRFQEIASATKRNIPPHVWDDMPETSRAEMIAFDRVESEMRRYEEHMAERRAEATRNSRGKGRRR